MAKNSLQYYFEREKAKQEQLDDIESLADKELKKKLKNIYEKAMDDIQSDIDRELSFLSAKENVSLADALQKISKFDVERFSRIAKRWVKEENKTEMANKWMRRYNVTMRTNRLELLRSYIGIASEKLANEEEQVTNDYLQEKTMDEFKAQAGIFLASVPTETYLERASASVLKASFNRTHFSERIWSNSEEMQADLMNAIRKVLIQGKHPTVASRELRKHIKAEFLGDKKTKGRNAKYIAERLAITEATFVQTDVHRLNYQEFGIEEYEYKAERKACSVCAALNGKVFKVSEMVSGKNAAPMHPFCKCSTSPHLKR